MSLAELSKGEGRSTPASSGAIVPTDATLKPPMQGPQTGGWQTKVRFAFLSQ
jgi:hypothetical protein